MPFRNYDPFTSFGGKIDPLSEIRNAGIVTNGNVVWVKSASDADYTTLKDAVGASNFRDTLQLGIDAARNDRNDYVLQTPTDGGTVITIGTSIDVNKSRVHVLGVGFNKNQQSYAITYRGFATTAAGTPLDTQYMEVTGGGVEIGGIRILGTAGTTTGGTVSNGILRVGTGSAGTAHDLWVHDSTLEFGMTTASGTPAVVTSPGTVHGARFSNVWFGNAADALEGVTAGVIALGAGGKRWLFEDCRFVHFAGSSGDRFVITGTGATEYVDFIRCQFLNLGTVAMASAVSGSVTVNNPILMDNCRYVAVTQAGTDPTVYKSPVASGTAASVRDYGIAVGTAALTPV